VTCACFSTDVLTTTEGSLKEVLNEDKTFCEFGIEQVLKIMVSRNLIDFKLQLNFP
jgi:hypothetical protein